MAKSLVMKQIREHRGIPDDKVREVKSAFEKDGIVSVVGPHGTGKTGIVHRALQELAQSKALCIMSTSGYFGIDHDQTVQSLYLQNQQFLFGVTDLVAQKSTSFWESFEREAKQLPTKNYSWAIVIEEFDLFATTNRQNLLYHLLEVTANPNILLIAITSNLNYMEKLEKRISSRFSQGIIFVPYPTEITMIQHVLKKWLFLPEKELEILTQSTQARDREEQEAMQVIGDVESMDVIPMTNTQFHRNWNDECAALLDSGEFRIYVKKFFERNKNFFHLARFIEVSLSFIGAGPLTIECCDRAWQLLYRDAYLEIGKGLNIVALMMLTSMNLLSLRDVPEINFELVYREYDQHVSGLGAADESLNRFVYSKAICLKGFQALYTLGIIECNSFHEKRPFASQLMNLAVMPSQVAAILKHQNCPTWMESWATTI